jgi:hypothetical protein
MLYCVSVTSDLLNVPKHLRAAIMKNADRGLYINALSLPGPADQQKYLPILFSFL